MRSTQLAFAVALGLASACATEPAIEPDVTTAVQALDACDVNTGKWQHLANLAVATAHEMGELDTRRQFTLVAWKGGQKVALSDYGTAVCAARGGCPMVQGYLALQELLNNELVPQELFNTIEYRNTLVDGYKRQAMQIDQLVMNGLWSELPEDNSTTLIGPDGTAFCGTQAFAFAARRDFHLKFSSSGPIPGMNCTRIAEPSDAPAWTNSYLCSERALGLKWSNRGAIAGMTCVPFNEPLDSAWADNYLCTPEDWGLSFSHDGAPAGKECVALQNPSAPNWIDNHLCWDPNAPLTHVGTLCQEFTLFGGAAPCLGNNPYIDFSVVGTGSVFRIDPTDYTPGSPNTTTTGQCYLSMPVVSTSPLDGACCYQGGRYGALVKYTTIPDAYYCRTS